MFEQGKSFYMTRAIAEELSQEHQEFIFLYINKNHEHLKEDYLQIFDFILVSDKQWVIQRQEEPERETIISVDLKSSEPIVRKVWVMDQGDHVIMLFPEDY